MTDSEDRAIGRLEAQVLHLTNTVEEVRRDVRVLTALMEQTRGAKWVVGAIGAVVGAVASFILAAFKLRQG